MLNIDFMKHIADGDEGLQVGTWACLMGFRCHRG